jgi:hypothetical protein
MQKNAAPGKQTAVTTTNKIMQTKGNVQSLIQSTKQSQKKRNFQE